MAKSSPSFPSASRPVCRLNPNEQSSYSSNQRSRANNPKHVLVPTDISPFPSAYDFVLSSPRSPTPDPSTQRPSPHATNFPENELPAVASSSAHNAPSVGMQWPTSGPPYDTPDTLCRNIIFYAHWMPMSDSDPGHCIRAYRPRSK